MGDGARYGRAPPVVRISKVDPSLPLNKFQKLMVECSRAQVSLIIQLRMGHVPLNAYLHRISKTDQPLCSFCKRGDETVHHYLFDCTTWAHERWLLGQGMGRASKLLRSLLSTE